MTPADSAAAPRYVLAIDNGSQSTKVHVVDQFGTVHATGRAALQPCVFPAPGQVVHPADDLWDSIVRACREALEAFDRPADAIEAVGLCTIRCCRALLNVDGGLVEPVLSWMDERVWRAYDPPGDERIAWITTSSGYLGHRLTGAFRDAAANYQGVWPIDEGAGQWSSDPADFERAGMPRRVLMELVQPGGRLGFVTAEAADRTGLPPGIAAYATANDKAVEALGAGLLIPTDGVLLSLGTYIAAMTVEQRRPEESDDYWVNVAASPDTALIESGGIRRGMWTVSWIRDLLESPNGRGAGETERLLELDASNVAPGCSGLSALMDWLSPTGRPYRRGALIGFDGTQGRGALYRCVLEGIALTMAGNIEAMESALGRRPTALTVTGGGAASDLMMQMLADILDRPTRRAGMQDAAGLGAAICAGVGSGIHSGWDTAVESMVSTGLAFAPDPAGVAAYRPVRTRYERLLRAAEPFMREVYADE